MVYLYKDLEDALRWVLRSIQERHAFPNWLQESFAAGKGSRHTKLLNLLYFIQLQ